MKSNYDFIAFDEKFDAGSHYSSENEDDSNISHRAAINFIAEKDQKYPIKRKLNRGITFHYPPNFDEKIINVTERGDLPKRTDLLYFQTNNQNDDVNSIKKNRHEEKKKSIPKINILTPEKIKSPIDNSTSKFYETGDISASTTVMLSHSNILHKYNEKENTNSSTNPQVDSSNLGLPLSKNLIKNDSKLSFTEEGQEKKISLLPPVQNEEDPFYDCSSLNSPQSLKQKDNIDINAEAEDETLNAIKKQKIIERKLRESEKYANIGCLLLPDDTFREVWDFIIIM